MAARIAKGVVLTWTWKNNDSWSHILEYPDVYVIMHNEVSWQSKMMDNAEFK